MAKNDFLTRQKQEKQKYMNIGFDIGYQQCFDWMCLALTDPEIMKKDTFGTERLWKILLGMEEWRKRLKDAFELDVAEADVKQRDMDELLKKAWKNDFVPFYERYPAMKALQYNKKWKG